MTSKSKIGLVLATVIAIAGLGILNIYDKTKVPVAAEQVAEQKVATVPRNPDSIFSPSALEREPNTPPVALRPINRKSLKPDPTATGTATPPKRGKQILDPVARVSLTLVGVDSGATEYWASAINNPNLSARERTNLIEDLNEDGLSDPKNPSEQDRQVILNRIQLIEQLVPRTIDDVNAAAFAEAHKDLVKMLKRLPLN